MTAQIADCIQRVLQPRGVGVVVDGAHECMTTRGVHKRGVSMVTSKMLGSFREDARTRAEFLQFIGRWTARTGVRVLFPLSWSGIALLSRSEEHKSELQSLMLNSYAVLC